MGKASPRITQTDRLNDSDIKRRELYGVGRKNQTGNPAQVAAVGLSSGGGVGGGSASPSGTQYLPTGGGSMSGPFALGPAFNTGLTTTPYKITVDSAGKRHYNVGTTGIYSSNSYIFPSTGNVSDTLDFIDGDAYDGQTLKLHVTAGTTITVNNTTQSNMGITGNIQNPLGLSVPFSGPCTINFIYDNQGIGGWILDTIQGIFTNIIPAVTNTYIVGINTNTNGVLPANNPTSSITGTTTRLWQGIYSSVLYTNAVLFGGLGQYSNVEIVYTPYSVSVPVGFLRYNVNQASGTQNGVAEVHSFQVGYSEVAQINISKVGDSLWGGGFVPGTANKYSLGYINLSSVTSSPLTWFNCALSGALYLFQENTTTQYITIFKSPYESFSGAYNAVYSLTDPVNTASEHQFVVNGETLLSIGPLGIYSNSGIVPSSTASYDLGGGLLSPPLYWRNVWLQGFVNLSSINTPSTPPSGTISLYVETSGSPPSQQATLYAINANGNRQIIAQWT